MLEELQSLSEGKKKQVLIIATIIIMVIIIGIWVAYFNSVVVGTAQETATQATSTDVAIAPVAPSMPAETAQANGPSLWQDIEGGFGSIVNIFRKPSQYTIQPK